MTERHIKIDLFLIQSTDVESMKSPCVYITYISLIAPESCSGDLSHCLIFTHPSYMFIDVYDSDRTGRCTSGAEIT